MEDSKIDPGHVDANGRCPLDEAIAKNSLWLVSFLIQHGAKVSQRMIGVSRGEVREVLHEYGSLDAHLHVLQEKIQQRTGIQDFEETFNECCKRAVGFRGFELADRLYHLVTDNNELREYDDFLRPRRSPRPPSQAPEAPGSDPAPPLDFASQSHTGTSSTELGRDKCDRPNCDRLASLFFHCNQHGCHRQDQKSSVCRQCFMLGCWAENEEGKLCADIGLPRGTLSVPPMSESSHSSMPPLSNPEATPVPENRRCSKCQEPLFGIRQPPPENGDQKPQQYGCDNDLCRLYGKAFWLCSGCMTRHDNTCPACGVVGKARSIGTDSSRPQWSSAPGSSKAVYDIVRIETQLVTIQEEDTRASASSSNYESDLCPVKLPPGPNDQYDYIMANFAGGYRHLSRCTFSGFRGLGIWDRHSDHMMACVFCFCRLHKGWRPVLKNVEAKGLMNHPNISMSSQAYHSNMHLYLGPARPDRDWFYAGVVCTHRDADFEHVQLFCARLKYLSVMWQTPDGPKPYFFIFEKRFEIC